MNSPSTLRHPPTIRSWLVSLVFCLPATVGLAAATAPANPAEQQEIINMPTQRVRDSLMKDARPGRDLFDLRAERQVDLLFVVDNSVSMRAEQDVLAKSFQDFIGAFVQRQLDFHIAILTTDAVDGQPRKGRSWSQPWLDRETPDLAAQFAKTVRVGTNGFYGETALRPVMAALDNPKLDGFFRPDSLLVVVIVSDEDESNGKGRPRPDRYVREDPAAETLLLDQFYAALLKAKGGRKGLCRVAAITGPDPVPEGCPAQTPGRTFRRAAERTNGPSASICQDFSADLTAIGNSLAEIAKRELSLRYPAIKKTIQLTINDQPVAEGETDGWTIDMRTNSLSLHGSALRQSYAAVVAVEYMWLPFPDTVNPETAGGKPLPEPELPAPTRP